MEPMDLALIAIVSTIGPAILDSLLQYIIHRHMENGRPPCKTCALKVVTSKLDNVERD